MIIDRPNTTVADLAKELVDIREEGGVFALSRVLTLVIMAEDDGEESAIRAANVASNEHPMRVIVIVPKASETPRVDAEIRVGSDAGASEVVVLRVYGEAGGDVETLITGLLLPDVPVVQQWPSTMPSEQQQDNLRSISNRRIFDANACADPRAALNTIINTYVPGDTDLSWARITLWRSHLAEMLDAAAGDTVNSVEITGNQYATVMIFMQQWLEMQLHCEIIVHHDNAEAQVVGGGISAVTLNFATGSATLAREDGTQSAVLSQPGQPNHELALPRRSLPECLAEELRQVGEDKLFGLVIDGLRSAA